MLFATTRKPRVKSRWLFIFVPPLNWCELVHWSSSNNHASTQAQAPRTQPSSPSLYISCSQHSRTKYSATTPRPGTESTSSLSVNPRLFASARIGLLVDIVPAWTRSTSSSLASLSKTYIAALPIPFPLALAARVSPMLASPACTCGIS